MQNIRVPMNFFYCVERIIRKSNKKSRTKTVDCQQKKRVNNDESVHLNYIYTNFVNKWGKKRSNNRQANYQQTHIEKGNLHKTSIKCQFKPFIEFKFAGATINLIKPNEPKMSDREREPLANNRNDKNGCYVMMARMKNDTLILRLN